jgi:hypothetical protein
MYMHGAIKKLILAIVLVVSTVSCDEAHPPKNQIEPKVGLDPVLGKINTFAAVMEMNLRLSEYTSCMLARQFQSMKVNNEFTRGMITEATSSCELYSRYIAATRKTYETIRAQGKLLDRQFAFAIFEHGGESEGGHTETEIGLFIDLASCKAMEVLTHERDVPTRQCYEWRDPIQKIESRR